MLIMKNTYTFALGTNHSLCKAEILNVLVQKNIKSTILAASSEVLIVQTDSPIEPKTFINELGSTAKIIEIVDFLPYQDFLKSFKEKFSTPEFQDFFLPKTENYVLMGLTVYNAGGKFKDLNNTWYLAPRIIKELRFSLSDINKSSGFIPLKERILSTVSFDKNKLSEKGFEIAFCTGKDGIYVGKTLTVQDYESYSFRDYDRPKKDVKSGMIPLKLARIMINLAGQDKTNTLLDPFCGSGTFLQEEIMLGFKNIIGTDLQQKAVNDSKENISWLFSNYPAIDKNNLNLKIEIANAENLSTIIKEDSVNAVITEPYLGSSNSKYFNEAKISFEQKNLKELYLKSLEEIYKTLKENGVLVIIFPVFRLNQKSLYLEIINEIKKIGFRMKSFIPEEFINEKEILKLELTERGSIVYYRPDQTVIREIFLFKKI